jgi:hypothetical protein
VRLLGDDPGSRSNSHNSSARFHWSLTDRSL